MIEKQRINEKKRRNGISGEIESLILVELIFILVNGRIWYVGNYNMWRMKNINE